MTIIGKRRVGFWVSKEPMMAIAELFIAELLGLGAEADLPDPRDLIDPKWDRRERAAVVEYLRDSRFEGEAYMGHSNCRICNVENGSRDYGDGLWVWPEGFAHYLTAHGVKPPKAFIQHVLKQQRTRKQR